MPDVIIRSETEQDYSSIREIHRSAFHRADEGNLVDNLREMGFAAVSLVAEQNGQVVGHILFSKLEEPAKALALGPVGVSPDVQSHGIGSALIRKGLEQVRVEGWMTIFVLGSPTYYNRFGFSIEAAKGYTCRYSGDHFMALPLNPEHRPVTMRVTYAAPFNTLD